MAATPVEAAAAACMARLLVASRCSSAVNCQHDHPSPSGGPAAAAAAASVVVVVGQVDKDNKPRGFVGATTHNTDNWVDAVDVVDAVSPVFSALFLV